MMYIRRLFFCVLLACTALPVGAMDISGIPDILKPWIPWVLDDQQQRQCPFFYRDFQQKHCRWSEPLLLELQEKEGRFQQNWTLYQAGWLELPGSNRHWPQHVTINQKPAVVLEQGSKPAVWLPAGRYRVSGDFSWDKLPESLAMAANVGLITLKINDQAISFPHIEQGAIWLNPKPSANSDAQQDSLDLQVFRQVIDDNPLQQTTRFVLNVAGAAREVTLPHALLPEFIPIRLDSPLPARLENDGRLLVQVRPGQWEITLQARSNKPLMQLDFTVQDASWPKAELWVFQAMPGLRLVEIEGAASIDASQTNLPAEWRHLPAYQIKQGQSMRFKLIRQGDPEPEPNQLSLKRTLWLDFAGEGYTVKDEINGKMTRDWRLNAEPETYLGQVLLNGQNQLVTRIDTQQGVEVRRGAIQLQADSRIEQGIGRLNAVGWQQLFQNVQTELNIPPGWRLLAVSGVDNDPDSWLNRWTLLDLFLVLIATMAIARLWSWHWGVLALLSLSLLWHEADAPRWIWLHTLAALALLRVLPNNRFSLWVKWYRNLCWLGLVLLVIPFMIAQIRVGLYPQLEKPWQAIQPDVYMQSMVASDEMAEAGVAMEMPAAAPPPSAKGQQKLTRSYSALADYAGGSDKFEQIDPDANLQTGPGLPQWQWHSVQLSWNGAVDNQQQLRLWFLSPMWNLLLHILQALLAAVLALKLLELIKPKFRFSWPGGLHMCLLMVLLALPSHGSWADIPDQTMLDQLKARLLQAPKCLPNCAQISDMAIATNADSMRIQLTIQAQEAVAVPLPAQMQQWFPEHISIDGQEALALMQQNQGQLWLGVDAGVHQLIMQGRHMPHYKFNLPLPLQPMYTTINSEGWRVDGWYENGKVGPQLEFSRLNVDKNQPTQVLQQTAMPAFVRVERTLQLGLDWRLSTRVIKLAGSDSPVVLEIPLLPGESVTSAHMRIKQGKVLVNMPVSQMSLEWQSILEKREHLELKAPDDAAWSELWRADVSPIWHLQTSGIAVVHHQDQQGSWLPEWRPWPGESVSLHITRPQAEPGQTLTIDKSELQIKPGKRSQSAELALSVRSSKGGQHSVTLPPQAVLQNVTIDGVSQPIRQKQQTVTLPIRPGSQQIALSWQSTLEQSTLLVTPELNLGSPSVNSHIKVANGNDRWVLLTLGPKFGPAALIWGVLLVMALLAAGLSKARLTPLKYWQWLLLLIGLSQVHVAAGLLVVAWLFALGFREKTKPDSVPYFNAFQVGLGMLTLMALFVLFVAVQQGLLGIPDMQITGNQSTAQNLNWYQDRSDATLPTAIVVSAPLMSYRLLMLAWSLWMALSLLAWLKWGWQCFSTDTLWKKKQPKPVKADQKGA